MHTDYGGAANVCVYCHPDAPGGKAAKWQFVPGSFLNQLVESKHHSFNKRSLTSIFNGVYKVRVKAGRLLAS